jgi:hypothetical protein
MHLTCMKKTEPASTQARVISQAGLWCFSNGAVSISCFFLIQSNLPIRMCFGRNLIRTVDTLRENLGVRTLVLKDRSFPMNRGLTLRMPHAS